MKRLLITTTAIAALAASAPAYAQDAESGTPAAASEQGDGAIVVTGIRRAMQDSIAAKRAAVGVVEAISSKDIGVLPDKTIAETITRLPGLNTSRDRGNESQATIRGLSSRLVLGLLNGRELASAEPDRGVRWEVFPSETVSGVNVYKSSQANIASGGISGTIDIQTIRPLDYSGPALTLRAGPVYYEGGESLPQQDNMGFRTSGAFVTRLTDNLGLSVAASYQLQQNGYESVGGGGWNDSRIPGLDAGAVDPAPGSPDVATPWGASIDVKSLKTPRYSIASTLQWRASDELEIRLDGLYSADKLREHDNGGWYSDWGNWGGYQTGTVANPGFTNNIIANGSLVKTDMTFNTTYNPYVSLYNQDKDLRAGGLNLKWSKDDWTVTADLAHSRAYRVGHWTAAIMSNNAGNMSYDYTGRLPTVYADIDAYQAAKNGQLMPGSGMNISNRMQDTLNSASLDVSRAMSGGFLSTVDFGLRFANRVKRSNDSHTLAFLSPLSPATPVAASLISPWNYSQFIVPTMIYADFDALTTALYGSAGHDALREKPGKNTPFVSKVTENVFEAYAMGNFDSTIGDTPIDGSFGVRLVNVDQSSEGKSNGVEVKEGRRYTYALPSFNLRAELAQDLFLKAGLSRALSRAPLNDLRVDRTFTVVGNPLSGGGGNPRLKPYTADQFDLGLEWYFHEGSLLSVAGFAKQIHNYIGFETRNITVAGAPLPVAFTSPYNRTDKGWVKGVEFAFQTPFYFIPGFEKLGVTSSLSLVDSDIKENTPAYNPLPMNGLAKTTAVADLWYADDVFDARVGLKYHSDYTLLYTWSSSALQTMRAETQLDFSMGYKFSDHVSTRFQVGNILNTPLRLYDNNNPSQIARNDVYGRTFQADVTFKF